MDRLRIVVSLAGLSALVHGQDLLWTRLGVPNQESLGQYLGVVGDVNGDGWSDLVTTGVGVGPLGYGYSVLILISGRDGSTIRIREGRPDIQNFSFERAMAAGDWDRDTVSDYAAVSRDALLGTRSVEVCSGRDDRVLWRIDRPWESYFGHSLLGDIDLNGNGRPDLLVYDANALAIEAFSDAGNILYTLRSTPTLPIWFAMDKVPDVNRDGCEDFVVGGGSTQDTFGRAYLLSGRTGTLLVEGLGERAGDHIGFSVASCGDIDGDGTADFAAGNSDFLTPRGVVRVFSGRSGAPIYTWTARNSRPGDAFGIAVSGGVDVDRDGIPDVLVATPGEPGPGGVGYSYVFSGRDGTILWSRGPNGLYGPYIATLPPQPGSSFGGFVIATTYANGIVRSYRGTPPGVEGFGSSCQGSVSKMLQIGLRDFGANGARLHLSGAEPGQTAFLAVGSSRATWNGQPLPMGLEPYGFPGCLLYVSPDVVIPAPIGTTGVARGHASVDIPRPLANPGTIVLHGQWLVPWQSTGGGTSDALLWRH